MRHIAFVLLAFGLFAIGIACGDDDDAPTATDTPADAATATTALEPTDAPTLTATPTATVRAAESPQATVPTLACPINDDSFCEFAEKIEHALATGDTAFILAHFTKGSIICEEQSISALCVGQPEGTIFQGYVVVPDAKVADPFMSAEQFTATLEAVAQVDEEASDEFGDGTWRLAAAVVHDTDGISLVLTMIGPDPIIEDLSLARRAFFVRASRGADGWTLGSFTTLLAGESHLRGYYGSGPIDGWLPWGGE